MRKRNSQRSSSSSRSTAARSSRQRGRSAESEYESSSGEFQENELQELFLDEVADLYNAEQQLTKALPKMAKAARSDELREAFETHLDETENHISRLEQVVEAIGESMKRKTCKAMKGLIDEGSEMMQEKKDSPGIDAVLIAAAQKVEHYEIASYGTVCAWAKLLNQQEALELLQETLQEEKTTDDKLTQIAESVANVEAEQD